MAKSVEGQEPKETTNEDLKPAGGDATPDPWKNLPEDLSWMRKEVEDARKDAAARRVEAKELKEKLAEAKSPEEVQKILADSEARVAEAELKATRALAARAANLPEGLDEFITGTTPEEIDKQVKKLAGLKPAAEQEEEPQFTKPAPRGGSNPARGPEAESAKALWAEYKKAHR